MLRDIWDFLFSHYVPFVTWTVIVAAIGGVAGIISAAVRDISKGDQVDPGGISPADGVKKYQNESEKPRDKEIG